MVLEGVSQLSTPTGYHMQLPYTVPTYVGGDPSHTAPMHNAMLAYSGVNPLCVAPIYGSVLMYDSSMFHVQLPSEPLRVILSIPDM